MSLHSTAQEIKFIEKLGRFVPSNVVSRPELLRRYVKAADKRIDWGDIDKEQAVQAAREELWKAV